MESIEIKAGRRKFVCTNRDRIMFNGEVYSLNTQKYTQGWEPIVSKKEFDRLKKLGVLKGPFRTKGCFGINLTFYDFNLEDEKIELPKKFSEDVKLLLEDMEKKEQAFHNAMNLLAVKAQPYLPIEVSAEYLPGDGACFGFDLGAVSYLLPMDITFDAIMRGEPITEDFMTWNSI